jgi:predicted dehydrogenase
MRYMFCWCKLYHFPASLATDFRARHVKNTSIGVGLIGCGSMGRVVAAELIRQYPPIQIRALCDPDPRSIEATRHTLAPNARVYHDHRQLARDPRISWVMIASWNCFHRAHAVAALQAGKHVFCQKPLATNLPDVLAIQRAAAKHRGMFNMGFTLRYSPHYRKLKELLAHGAIGQLVSLEFNETLDFNHGGYIMATGWQDGLKSAITCFGIDRAMETGQVVDMRPLWKRAGIRS